MVPPRRCSGGGVRPACPETTPRVIRFKRGVPTNWTMTASTVHPFVREPRTSPRGWSLGSPIASPGVRRLPSPHSSTWPTGTPGQHRSLTRADRSRGLPPRPAERRRWRHPTYGDHSRRISPEGRKATARDLGTREPTRPQTRRRPIANRERGGISTTARRDSSHPTIAKTVTRHARCTLGEDGNRRVGPPNKTCDEAPPSGGASSFPCLLQVALDRR